MKTLESAKFIILHYKLPPPHWVQGVWKGFLSEVYNPQKGRPTTVHTELNKHVALTMGRKIIATSMSRSCEKQPTASHNE